MTVDLFDTRSGNIVDEFESREEAEAFLAENFSDPAQDEFGDECVEADFFRILEADEAE